MDDAPGHRRRALWATLGVDAALALLAAVLFAVLLPARSEYSDRHGHAA